MKNLFGTVWAILALVAVFGFLSSVAHGKPRRGCSQVTTPQFSPVAPSYAPVVQQANYPVATPSVKERPSYAIPSGMFAPSCQGGNCPVPTVTYGRYR